MIVINELRPIPNVQSDLIPFQLCYSCMLFIMFLNPFLHFHTLHTFTFLFYMYTKFSSSILSFIMFEKFGAFTVSFLLRESKMEQDEQK